MPHNAGCIPWPNRLPRKLETVRILWKANVLPCPAGPVAEGYLCIPKSSLYIGKTGLATLKSPQFRFEDGVMLTPVTPHHGIIRNFSRQRHATEFPLLFLLALVTIATGCSSLNAGNAGSTTAATNPATPIAMSAVLPPATIGSAYNAVISVKGGSPPYSFAVRSGKLPAGLKLEATSGSITGQPLRSGSYPFTIAVADHARTAAGLKKFAITVSRATKVPVQVTISPASFALPPGGSHQFVAQVSNASSNVVTWAASAGTITAAGLFTAPKVTAPATVQITATSKVDPAKHGTATVTLDAHTTPATLALANTSLPDATEGTPYSVTLYLSGGTAPYHWKIASGSLPAGFALDASEGVISGVASDSGAFAFTIAASDGAGQSVSRALAIRVSQANASNYDGPAELPRLYVKSSLSDTPASGATHLVKSGGDLQSALNSATCGDTIQLQAGATFTGAFVLPAKNCDEQHWIVVRTSAPDNALPPEGTRLTPCYAGVTSLPGRPSFGCSSSNNVLAKLVFSSTGSGPITLANGANHYRLTGLEITRTPGTTVYNLVLNQSNGTADHIVIDRSWIHGTAQDETTRGVMLVASSYVAIVDSFFSDFHCVAISGSCTDSQAIAGGLGSNAMGPYKIVNNFLEASGENIIFGGGAADHTPEDIEIRHNYFYKPLIWMKGQPGFVGGRDGNPFIVKNHFELKNGIRVLFEGNVLENSWGGFSQTGFAILLTPKNQNGLCPLCVVHDITLRYNRVSHTGNGFQISNGPSDSGALSLGMWNVSIHDVVMDDISSTTYNGVGVLFQESNGNHVSPLHDVAINHVTALSKDSTAPMMSVGNDTSYPEMYGFTWSNNIFTGGIGVHTTGGGPSNCAFQLDSAGVLASCFKQPGFSHNALIGATGHWPTQNFFVNSLADIKFTSTGSSPVPGALPVVGFQLQSSSPYAGAGTDGKDLGADVQALDAAVSGVR